MLVNDRKNTPKNQLNCALLVRHKAHEINEALRGDTVRIYGDELEALSRHEASQHEVPGAVFAVRRMTYTVVANIPDAFESLDLWEGSP
jgi:hypothetical protein